MLSGASPTLPADVILLSSQRNLGRLLNTLPGLWSSLRWLSQRPAGSSARAGSGQTHLWDARAQHHVEQSQGADTEQKRHQNFKLENAGVKALMRTHSSESPTHPHWGLKLVPPVWETVWQHLPKLKVCQAAIPLLRMYPHPRNASIHWPPDMP